PRVVGGAAGFLEPGMLIGSVIEHHLDDHANVAVVSGLQEELEVIKVSVIGMDGSVVGDVVAIVPQRRGKEWHEPEGVYAEFLKVIELLRQAAKIADTVAVGVEECADVDLVNNCVLVPEHVLRYCHDSVLRLLDFSSDPAMSLDETERRS